MQVLKLVGCFLLAVSLIGNAIQFWLRGLDRTEIEELQQRINQIATEYADTKKSLARAVIERDKAIEAKEEAEEVRDETERQCLVTQASIGSVFQVLREEEGEECFTSFRDAILHPGPHLLVESLH